jgi:hypothetical protein
LFEFFVKFIDSFSRKVVGQLFDPRKQGNSGAGAAAAEGSGKKK